LGAILYIILTALLPFKQAFDHNYFNFLKNPEAHLKHYGKKLEPQAIDLIMSMLTQDPNERFSIEQILSHPWMTQECAT